MKVSKLMSGVVLPVCVFLLLFSAPVSAGGKYERKGGEMMMMEHPQMTRDMMEMMKETMEIIRDLNHTPSSSDKKKLEAMMKKLEGMMKKMDEKEY